MTNKIEINTNLFKAISDESRLRIVLLLSVNEMCVCEICETTGLSQPMVSRHLGLLRTLNIVSTRRAGQWIYYSINREEPLVLSMLSVLIEHLSPSSIFQRDFDNYAIKRNEEKLCSQKASLSETK